MGNPYTRKDSDDHRTELVFIRKYDYVRIKVMAKINGGISELKFENVWQRDHRNRYQESTVSVRYHCIKNPSNDYGLKCYHQ